MQSGFGETVTILVVEDDIAVAQLLRSVLNDVPGWGATIVHDASAAREIFRHIKIEVLVLDLNLSGISGLELLELLRRDPGWSELPVILMSSEPHQTGISEAVESGRIMHFIAKPFDVDQLVQVVRRAVAEYFSSH
jgi:DNA-binding response OmpR family regulator